MFLVQIGCRNSNLTLTPKPEKKSCLKEFIVSYNMNFKNTN